MIVYKALVILRGLLSPTKFFSSMKLVLNLSLSNFD